MTDPSAGSAGNVGNPPQGGHGGAGGTGGAGGVGTPGQTGPRGPRGAQYSSWLTRNVLAAYLLLACGVIAAFATIGYNASSTTERIETKFRMGCEAGNDRSRLQEEDYRESADQLDKLDLQRLFNIGPEQVAEFRRLSRESTERRIAALPYLDCRTGQRIPGP